MKSQKVEYIQSIWLQNICRNNQYFNKLSKRCVRHSFYVNCQTLVRLSETFLKLKSLFSEDHFVCQSPDVEKRFWSEFMSFESAQIAEVILLVIDFDLNPFSSLIHTFYRRSNVVYVYLGVKESLLLRRI